MTSPQQEQRPPDRARQARIMNRINIVMRFVLSLPFPTPLSGRLMLLRLTGRKTGRVYRMPVSYIRHEDVLLTPGGGRWTLNLSNDHLVPVRLRGRKIPARPELISDPDEVERLLDIIVAANPAAQRFIRIPRDPDGRLNRTALTNATKYGFRIVRWHLSPADLPGRA